MQKMFPFDDIIKKAGLSIGALEAYFSDIFIKDIKKYSNKMH